jgi:hypothetical protein
VGWEARKTPARGKVFFLDFPLYRTYQDVGAVYVFLMCCIGQTFEIEKSIKTPQD